MVSEAHMSLKEKIEMVIRESLAPESLEVEDFSQSHVGHREDGSHFSVRIVSQAFEGKGRVARERLVSSLFEADISSGRIHALTISAKTPGEIDGAPPAKIG